MSCDHSWESICIFGKNRIVHDGVVTELPNVAWCAECDARWELTDTEVAAAEAILEGKIVVAKASNTERKP